jgi:hypothetical protein
MRMSDARTRRRSLSAQRHTTALARSLHQSRQRRRLRGIAPLIVLALLGALTLSGSAGARSGHEATAAAAGSSHLQVTEVEYRLLLSRGIVKAGPVDLEAIDRGLVPHDLRLRAASAQGGIAAPELSPGQRWNGVVNLKPGIYRLWCSLPEHARLGMHTTLTAVR